MKLKRLLSLSLVIIMIVSLSSVAFAAEINAPVAATKEGSNPNARAAGYYFSSLTWKGDEYDCNYGQGQKARAKNKMVIEGYLCNADGSPARNIAVYAECFNPETGRFKTNGWMTGSDGYFYIEITPMPMGQGVNSYAAYSWHYYDISILTIYWDDPDNGSLWWWQTDFYQLIYTR